MTKILQKHSKACIKDYEEKISYSYWDYLVDPSNRFTAIIKNIVLKNEPKCWAELSVSSGLFTLIESSYTSWVWKPFSDTFIDKIYRFTQWWLVWKVALEKYLEDWKEALEPILPSELIYENWVYSRVIFFCNYEDKWEFQDEEKVHYAYKKSYLEGENIHQLFKMDQWSGYEGALVDINSIPQTQGIDFSKLWDDWFSAIEDTGFKGLAIISKDTHPFIDTYWPIIHSIDRKLTTSDKELLQVVKTKILAIWADKIKGSETAEDIWKWDIGADIKHIHQENNNLDKMLDFIKEQKWQLSGLLSLPPSDIWLEDSWTGTWEKAMIVKRAQFTHRMSEIRDLFEYMAKQLVPDAVFKWRDMNVDDEATKLDNLEKALSIPVITPLQAVARYNNVSDEEAVDLLTSINNENTWTEQS